MKATPRHSLRKSMSDQALLTARTAAAGAGAKENAAKKPRTEVCQTQQQNVV